MNAWSNSDLRDLIASFEEGLDWEFDVDEFDDRLKMQKLVYFAREFGLEVPYRYNIYRYGPYSPSLARDYFEVNGTGNAREAAALFDSTAFVEFVSGRDNDWLEIAATIHKLEREFRKSYPPDEVRENVIARAANMKKISEARASTIYDELGAVL